MHRGYHHWFSPVLGRVMQVLVFGHAGTRAIVFPTRCGRFYDFENFGMVEACREALEAGRVQLFCVDSYDEQSVYAGWMRPADRMPCHQRYEQYLLDEVLPFTRHQNPAPGDKALAIGCSLGAWHALNLAARHPWHFNRVLALSGRYDLTRAFGHYLDLFDGYYDDTIYFNTPSHFLPRLANHDLLSRLRDMRIDLGCGADDVIIGNNRELESCLRDRSVPVALHTWDGEGHRPRAWRPMLTRSL